METLKTTELFTEAISAKECKVVTVKGNAGDVVRFEACRGSYGITDEAITTDDSNANTGRNNKGAIIYGKR